jgi:hypothetical protein
MLAMFSSGHLVFLSALKHTKITIYESTVLPLVLYRYETLSLTFAEEHRLRMFVDSVLKRIFGPKRNKMTGGWRRPPLWSCGQSSWLQTQRSGSYQIF